MNPCPRFWWHPQFGPYLLELDQETDGRWTCENKHLPGVLVYGETEDAAIRAARALSLRVLADRIENEEPL